MSGNCPNLPKIGKFWKSQGIFQKVCPTRRLSREYFSFDRKFGATTFLFCIQSMSRILIFTPKSLSRSLEISENVREKSWKYQGISFCDFCGHPVYQKKLILNKKDVLVIYKPPFFYI